MCVCVCAGLLGIEDLSKVTYGDSVELQPGDVPVFWACGVTAMEAISSSSKAAPAAATVIFSSFSCLEN